MVNPIRILEGDPRCLHAQAIKNSITPISHNIAFFNNLITLYSKFNLQSSALQLFHSIPCPNTVIWTLIISTFSSSLHALRLFLSMLGLPRQQTLPNARTLSTLLRTCVSLPDFWLGQQLHSLSIKLCLHENSYVASAFVSLYCKARDLDVAVKVFDEMPDRDEVCYAAVINGLAQNKKPTEALKYFVEMKRQSVFLTYQSISRALSAASKVAMLQQCMIIHAHAVVTGFDSSIYVGTTLIDGYGRCGVVEEARGVFDEFEMVLNLACWNALIIAHAQQGSQQIVLELFITMERRGYKADECSFLAILMAFCNASVANETEMWLNTMRTRYGITADQTIYVNGGCIGERIVTRLSSILAWWQRGRS